MYVCVWLERFVDKETTVQLQHRYNLQKAHSGQTVYPIKLYLG